MYKKIFNQTLILFACSLCMLTFSGRVSADEYISLDMFHIERNKNRNLVKYAVYVNQETCLPGNSEPAHVYWRNLEVSPTDVSNLLIFELPAYGIDSQSIKNGILHMRLEALTEKQITVEFAKTDSGCTAIPLMSINEKEAVLKEVYVYAKERKFWLPKVIWIEIRGEDTPGNLVKQRIDVD